jgi:hypothetical protein
MVNQLDWDLIYHAENNNFKLNPTNLAQPPARSPVEAASIFHRFDLLLRHLKALQKIHLLEITPELKKAIKTLHPTSADMTKCYKMSIEWAEEYFEYKPKFIYSHFTRFFKVDSQNWKASNSIA